MSAKHLRRDSSYLHTHRLLLRVGLSLAMMFSWIFVFQYFLGFSNNLPAAFGATIVAYGLSQVIMMILTPFSAAHLRHGIKRSLCYGALVLASAFAVLGGTLAGYFSSPLGWGIVLFAFLLGLYRALYWIPYRLKSIPSQKGPHFLYESLVALMPAFAGVALTTVDLGPLRLLFGAAVIMLLSLIPIIPLEDVRERFSWSYGQTYRNLFDNRNRALSCRAVLNGIQSAALFLLWPLAVFLIVGRSYLVMGIVISASLLALLIVHSFSRAGIRSLIARESIVLDVTFSMSGWIFRLAAGTPLAVVFADSYSYVSTPFGAPDVLAGEHVADSGSYVDEYTALNEIGLGLGRVVMCAFSVLLILTVPLPLALLLSLVLAACSAGGATVLGHRMKVVAY